MLFLNVHPGVSSGARCLSFGLSLHLLPYLLYAISEGSGETVLMRRLVWDFAARRSCGEKGQNLHAQYGKCVLLGFWTKIGDLKESNKF